MHQAPRGTSDILPDDQPIWQFVTERAEETARLNSYRRLDTPVFEDAQLFIRSIGEGTDIVTKETYTFEDRGGNLITLRPEGTAPVCRSYLEHGMASLPQPVRMYYLATIYRYERPQAGRYREHHQFGYEAIGEADPLLDAEVIEMAVNFYDSLGITGTTLKLNSIGCPSCRPIYINRLKEYYHGRIEGLCQDCKTRFDRNALRLLDCKKDTCREETSSAPKSLDFLCPECRRHFDLLFGYLHNLEIDFETDHRLVRGLDYYTKTVFEVHPSGAAGAQSALGGGGRYDGLIEGLGGRPTPAVGFATGIERLIRELRNQGATDFKVLCPLVFVAAVGDKAKTQAVVLASKIRKSGSQVVIATGERSLKAQLRAANSSGSRFCVILGDDELARGEISLRDMKNGEQSTLKSEELIDYIKNQRL